MPTAQGVITICRFCERTMGEHGGSKPKKIMLGVCAECQGKKETQNAS